VLLAHPLGVKSAKHVLAPQPYYAFGVLAIPLFRTQVSVRAAAGLHLRAKSSYAFGAFSELKPPASDSCHRVCLPGFQIQSAGKNLIIPFRRKEFPLGKFKFLNGLLDPVPGKHTAR